MRWPILFAFAGGFISGCGGKAAKVAVTPCRIDSTPVGGDGVTCSSPTQCTVSTQVVDRILQAGPGGLAGLARVHPVTGGYRLDDLKAGSILQNVGLERGDVIQTVNGLDPDNPALAAQAFMLDAGDTVSAAIDRDGCTFTLTLKIVPG